jgi:molybdopterin synthase sulfur carrier subunit
VTVLLPSTLTSRTGNRTSVAVSGATVRDVIAALDAAHPGLRFNLCHETGELRPFVNIFVNGVHVRYLRGIETPLAPGAMLHIMPSVAGG